MALPERHAEAEEAHPPDDAPAGEVSRFRVLKIGARRRAFSIEGAFWAALEEMAARAGLRLSSQIERILGASSNGNATSLLRVRAVEWLMEDRHRLAAATDGRRIGQRVVSTIPSPAFVIDGHKRVVAFNHAFRALSEADDGNAAAAGGAARLHIAVPLPKLLELLHDDPDKIYTVDVVLELAQNRINRRIRTSLIGAEPGAPYLLCVII